MSDRPANGPGNAAPAFPEIDAATRRLMAALEALESAVERRREADRDENELAVRIQALGVAQARAHQSRDRRTAGCRDRHHPLRARCGREFMSHINVSINGRQYRMACEEGQEARLQKLAESLETRIGSLRGKFGEIGDARLVVMAALTVCDELVDATGRISNLEKEIDALRDVRAVAADHARATQTAVANALNAAADRIEKTTQVLNRTIGGGVAIG
jgi:cell division protein ZapA